MPICVYTILVLILLQYNTNLCLSYEKYVSNYTLVSRVVQLKSSLKRYFCIIQNFFYHFSNVTSKINTVCISLWCLYFKIIEKNILNFTDYCWCCLGCLFLFHIFLFIIIGFC